MVCGKQIQFNALRMAVHIAKRILVSTEDTSILLFQALAFVLSCGKTVPCARHIDVDPLVLPMEMGQPVSAREDFRAPSVTFRQPVVKMEAITTRVAEAVSVRQCGTTEVYVLPASVVHLARLRPTGKRVFVRIIIPGLIAKSRQSIANTEVCHIRLLRRVTATVRLLGREPSVKIQFAAFMAPLHQMALLACVLGATLD
jgi:hypothetical protein